MAFRVSDLAFFCAAAAASGVIGNLAYATLLGIVRTVRRPKKEIGTKNVRFDTVISRKTYNHIRREQNPNSGPKRRAPKQIEHEIETKYQLIVKLTRNSRR
jgi:hypothetical protein